MNNQIRSSKYKDEFWQIIRGICIICVILIHCKNGVEYRNDSTNYWNFDYWFILRQLINFPIAIFIFLSGNFINVQKVKKSTLNYIYNRIKRLFIPFMLWTSFYTLIKVINNVEEINFIKLLFGLSSAHLYYIIVLIQLTLLTPLLIRDIQNNKRTKFWILITPIYLVYLYFYMIINKKQIPFYQTYFPAWFIFYYIGLSVKINGYKFLYKNNQISISLIMCIVSFILSIFEGYMLLSLGLLESIASSQIKISTFLYTFTLIKLIMKIKLYSQDNKIKWLKYIGDNSYGIYLAP